MDQVTKKECALFLAYGRGVDKGHIAYKELCSGREYSSIYIKENQERSWFKRIVLLLQGFSRIGTTDYYGKTGIFTTYDKCIRKGLKIFSGALDPDRCRGAVKNIIRIGGNKANTSFLDYMPRKAESIRTYLSSYQKIDINAKGKGVKLDQERPKIDAIEEVNENGVSIASTSGGVGYMEDRTAVGEIEINGTKAQFFTVLDGHGGTGAAEYLSKEMKNLLQDLFNAFFTKEQDIDVYAMEEACSQIGLFLNEKVHQKRVDQVADLQKIGEELTDILNSTSSFQNQQSNTLIEKEVQESVQKMCASLNKHINKHLDIPPKGLIHLERFAEEAPSAFDKMNFESKLLLREKLKAIQDAIEMYSGTTLSLAIVYQGRIWSINVGDSRIVAVTDNSIVQLTHDADPADEKFAKNVRKREGDISASHRVGNILATTHSIGDSSIKGVSAKAKVTCFHLEKETKLIIGSDGLFETMTSKEAGSLIQDSKNKSDTVLVKELVEKAYTTGSEDNITALVISLAPSF